MINGSTAFNNAVSAGGYPYVARIKQNDVVIDCDITTCSITKGSVGSEEFNLGVGFVPYVELEVRDLTTALENTEITLDVGVRISDSDTEWITMGYFTVAKAPASAVLTTITAVGRISGVLSGIFPTAPATITAETLLAAIQTAVRNSGYATFTINNVGVTIPSEVLNLDITGLTCRDILGELGKILGCYITEDSEGNVVLFKYNTLVTVNYNGDRMITHPTFNENDFNLAGLKIVYEAGYEDEDGQLVPEKFFTTDPPVTLTLANPYITTQTLFNTFCDNCLGLMYTPADVTLAYGDPRLEPFDVLRITDTLGVQRLVPCMGITHTITGGLVTQVVAPGKSEAEEGLTTPGPLTQQLESLNAQLLSVNEAVINRLKVSELTAQRISAIVIDAINLTSDTIDAKNINVAQLTATQAFINALDAKLIDAGVITVGDLRAGVVSADIITAINLAATQIDADRLNVTQLVAKQAFLDAVTAQVATLGYAHITNGVIDNAKIGYADVNGLSANYAHITSGIIDNAKIEYADVNGLSANYASISDLNAAKGRISTLEANEAVVNDTLRATNANVEYLKSDWISTDRLVLTGNNKNNYPPVEITESEFNTNKTAYWTKNGDTYTQCTQQSVYDADEQYYVRQTVKSIIEAINTANSSDPQIVVSNDKLIAASMDVAELSAITADMGELTAGKIQKGNNFINLDTSPASMEFKNASTWANATQGLQFDTQGNLNIKGSVNVTSGNVYTKTEADDKYVQASDSKSGSIVTWENMLIDDLDVDIEPIQSLHGYDKPWSGGAGKNKCPFFTAGTSNGITFTVGADGVVTANGTATADAWLILNLETSTVYGDFYFNGAYGGAPTTYNMYVWDTTAGSRVKKWNGTTSSDNGYQNLTEIKLVQNHATQIVCRVMSGRTVNNVKFYPMIVASSVSDATYEPYSNICPISGYDSVVVSRCGVNVWDEEWELGVFDNATGQKINNNSNSRSKNYISVKPSTQYYFKSVSNGRFFFYKADKTYISTQAKVANTVITTPSEAHYMMFQFGGTTYNHDISINYPSTDTSYHAYNGNTYTTDLSGTRYGGTLDVASGVLTVTKAIVDMTNYASRWTADIAHERAYVTVNEFKTPLAQPANIICNRFKTVDTTKIYTMEEYGVGLSSGNALQFRISGVTDQPTATTATVAEYFANNPTQVVYELATPTTVQLTAQEVSALVGTNVLWANSGDVHVELTGVKDYADEISELKVTADGISTEVAKKTDKATIISTIRQSAESVKIKASQVEIDGTATFNAIKSQADAAYDSKGSASAVQTNLDNLEIDVQAEIDAKKSIHTLDTAYSYTYANILTYSAEGHSDSWNLASPSTTTGVKVGDTVRLKVTVSDMSNAAVYIVGTVTNVASGRTDRLTMTSHGLDTTIIDGGNIITGSVTANQIAANSITLGKIDSRLQRSLNWYATCDTAAATTAKVATISPATTEFTLSEGVSVNVKFTNTNSGAVGSITLNVNNTGAKSIKYINNTAISNIPSAGYIVSGVTYQFVYDGTYWVIQNLNYNTNDNDRKRISNGVIVAENITQYCIAGRSAEQNVTGHKKLVANLEIDLTFPICYLNQANISGQSYAVASGSTTTNFYTAYPSVNLQNTKISWTGTNRAVCYIKGTLTGQKFKVHSDVFTTSIPSNNDGFAYIPIGIMYSTTQVNFACDNTVYAFRNGSFHKIDTVSDYVTQIDESGIWITPPELKPTNTSTGANATGTKINADGLDIYQEGTSVAHYGDYARIGKDGEANTRISPNEVTISASDDISALRITPDGNTQSVWYYGHINKKLSAGDSYTYTHPSGADSNSKITYVIRSKAGGKKTITVTKGQTTAATTVATPFKFKYSATTSALTITNNESSQYIVLYEMSFRKTSTSPLIEAGGVLTLGQYPDIAMHTRLVVGNGTADTAVSNAFEVTNYGDVYANGVLYTNGGSTEISNGTVVFGQKNDGTAQGYIFQWKSGNVTSNASGLINLSSAFGIDYNNAAGITVNCVTSNYKVSGVTAWNGYWYGILSQFNSAAVVPNTTVNLVVSWFRGIT